MKNVIKLYRSDDKTKYEEPVSYFEKNKEEEGAPMTEYGFGVFLCTEKKHAREWESEFSGKLHEYELNTAGLKVKTLELHTLDWYLEIHKWIEQKCEYDVLFIPTPYEPEYANFVFETVHRKGLDTDEALQEYIMECERQRKFLGYSREPGRDFEKEENLDIRMECALITKKAIDALKCVE